MTRVETLVQMINLEKLRSEGLILDIGGGGEGLVSRIGGENVCVVDIRMSEIREAQIHGAPANWFVSDGQKLCFRDDSFDLVTLWFSLGYLREWDVKLRVLEETKRVMTKQGKISILASKIPESAERFVFWAHFKLPDGSISQTGYGVRGNQGQTLEKVVELLNDLEFRILKKEDHGEWFRISAVPS
jgi:ubiquinone/menaquinone biosynthesis C-methylase UbiE